MRAVSFLRALSYSGPVALCCDDTKLTPCLSPYWDKGRGCFVLVGVAGEPVEVADAAALTNILESGRIQKANKVRYLIEYSQRGLKGIFICPSW